MVGQTTENDLETSHSTPSNSSIETKRRFISAVENKYEALIEMGKRKLGYYRPEVSDQDRFLMSFLIYFTVLLMVVFVADYLAQKTYEDNDSLGPLQHLEVEIVYTVQKDIFNMPVTVNRTSNTIWYKTDVDWNGQNFTQEERIGGFGLEIGSVCTGFHEMIFLGVLVMGFKGVPVKLRAKWTAILLSIVFVENLFRIFALYPLALYKGRDFEEWFHFYWWHYGQYVFIMALFGLWFFFVARKYVNPDEYVGSGNSGKDEDLSCPSPDGASSDTMTRQGIDPASTTDSPDPEHDGMSPDDGIPDNELEYIPDGVPSEILMKTTSQPLGPDDKSETMLTSSPGIEPTPATDPDILASFNDIDGWWEKWNNDLDRISKL